jgi:hypothetical protein
MLKAPFGSFDECVFPLVSINIKLWIRRELCDTRIIGKKPKRDSKPGGNIPV